MVSSDYNMCRECNDQENFIAKRTDVIVVALEVKCKPRSYGLLPYRQQASNKCVPMGLFRCDEINL